MRQSYRLDDNFGLQVQNNTIAHTKSSLPYQSRTRTKYKAMIHFPGSSLANLHLRALRSWTRDASCRPPACPPTCLCTRLPAQPLASYPFSRLSQVVKVGRVCSAKSNISPLLLSHISSHGEVKIIIVELYSTGIRHGYCWRRRKEKFGGSGAGTISKSGMDMC